MSEYIGHYRRYSTTKDYKVKAMEHSMNENDKHIINSLRNNARVSLRKVAKELLIPPSTVFDRVKKHTGYSILKHTSLVNFTDFGYYKRSLLVLSVVLDCALVECFLSQSESVNSLYKINGGYDFLVEAIFRDEKEQGKFLQNLQERECVIHDNISIIKDIRREEFKL